LTGWSSTITIVLMSGHAIREDANEHRESRPPPFFDQTA
jgi:hypothetical protein